MELGINFVDTAYVYGDGLSERLIGQALRATPRHHDVYIATKIPPKNMDWPAVPTTPLREAFPADWIRACTERSLRNLGVECIDLQQFHVWTDAWAHEAEWIAAVQRLKREGKIRAFGVSINDHEPESAVALVRSGQIEAVQVIYNVFDQQPAEALLPLCQAHDVGVIARVPFDEGGLTGTLTPETTFPRDDWRRDYFTRERLRFTVERVERLRPLLLRGEVTTVAHGALRFCLSHPTISTVIPGMRTVAHVEDNAGVSTGRYYTAEELVRLKAHAWPKNFYAGIW